MSLRLEVSVCFDYDLIAVWTAYTTTTDVNPIHKGTTMAKKIEGVNKSEEVRQLLKANPW